MNRGDRRLCRVAGKSDTIDAEAAARSVLAGQATATPNLEIANSLKLGTRTTAPRNT